MPTRTSAGTRSDSPEYVRLTVLLADLIEANGSKRPSDRQVATWRNDVRLMVEQDGRTVEQIEAAIRWAQRHHFWRSNILSMAKLRAQYDRLRLQAQRDRRSAGADGVAGVREMLGRVARGQA